MAKLQLAVGAFGEEVKDLHRSLAKHRLAIPSGELDRTFSARQPRTRLCDGSEAMDYPQPESLTTEPPRHSKRRLNRLLPNKKALARSLRPEPQLLRPVREKFSP